MMDHSGFEALLRAVMPDGPDIRVESVVPLAGGWSAETSRVRGKGKDGEFDVVVRRTPPEGLLAPYDIEREWQILCALHRSPIPVAEPLGRDVDGHYLGAPCLVTRYVDAAPLPFFGETIGGDDARLPAYFAMLAAIHELDWRRCGLSFLDELDDPIEPELRRSEMRLLYVHRLGESERNRLAWLRAHRPPDATRALLHGDPNPANYLVRGTRVAAVLDWELCVLGDPRIDLGFVAAVRELFGGVWPLSTRQFVAGYATARPGAALTNLPYFEAMGLFRLSAFVHAAEVQRGADVTELRRRLDTRFDAILRGGGRSTDPFATVGGGP